MIMLCFLLLMAMRNGRIDDQQSLGSVSPKDKQCRMSSKCQIPYKNVIQMSEVDKLIWNLCHFPQSNSFTDLVRNLEILLVSVPKN